MTTYFFSRTQLKGFMQFCHVSVLICNVQGRVFYKELNKIQYYLVILFIFVLTAHCCNLLST